MVALRKESVDRNKMSKIAGMYEVGVALRKESVDRNGKFVLQSPEKEASLSARRAWIEIRMYPLPRSATAVALRKESVDRNFLE